MKKLIIAAGLLAAGLIVGCGRNDGRKVLAAEGFEIPRSLVTRMLDAHDRVRDKFLNNTNDFDSLELLIAGDMTNVEEIASRPRGRMKFCDDLLTDEQRQTWWPFDFEKFEVELESKLELSEEYGFRIKIELAESVGGGTNDDGYVASNPTIRWVNAEIENWAIKVWDEQKDRLDDAQLRKLLWRGGNPRRDGRLDGERRDSLRHSATCGCLEPARLYICVLQGWREYGDDDFV